MEQLRGVVHGRTIELETEPGLADGQWVTIVVCTETAGTQPEQQLASESLRRAFGAWAEDEKELDEYLEWNRRQRKAGRQELAS
jgi:hypothetical protein